MAENIIIKITAESDLSKANADLQALQDNEKDIANEMRKQSAEYTKQVANIQNTVKGREAQIAALDKLSAAQKKQQAGLETELKKTKASLQDFNAKMGQVNDTVAKGAVQTPRLRTQMMALKDELAKMEMAGDNSSKAFVNLSVKAGKLQDQMGDTQQTIRVLSSDTRGLDTAMGVGQGLAGAFSVATSAAALLGGENEDLQKAFFKVQAVMSILNGVNEVALMLNKNSVVMVNLQTYASESNTLSKIKNFGATATQNATTLIQTGLDSKSTIVKGIATAAQWAMNIAVLAFPAIAIVAALAAIVGGFYAYSTSASDAQIAQDKLNNSVDQFNANATETERTQNHIVDVLKAKGATSEEIRKTEKSYADQNLAIATAEYERLLRNDKATEEQLKAAGDAKKAALVTQQDLTRRYIIEDLTATTKANEDKINKQKEYDKEFLSEQKRQNELKKAEHKKYLEDIKKWDYESQVQSIRNEKARTEVITTEIGKISTTKVATAASETERAASILNAGIEKEKETTNESINLAKEKADKEKAIQEAAIQFGVEVGNMLFDSKREKLSQELSYLDKFYTTDAEAAKANSKLKLISEEELSKKKLEIKIKQAKIDKEQALFNIAIGTAQNIIGAKLNPVLIGLAIALGLAQTVAVASRPLPKYAKGRKGGGAERAEISEAGGEFVYYPNRSIVDLPRGASVIPAWKSKNLSLATMMEYGAMPNIGEFGGSTGFNIDYNKLGKAVADNVNIPTQKHVTVNVDKRGINVQDGLQSTNYLNRKYASQWN